MTDLPPPQTPEGWYPDGVPGSERWWSGTRWTEQTRAAGEGLKEPTRAGSGSLLVRGSTGYAELSGGVLLYRTKPDRPPLLRIELDTVQAIVVSRNRASFDVVLQGAKPRSRPSLLSETSLQRGARTPVDEWEAFLAALEAAVAAAVPKFLPR